MYWESELRIDSDGFTHRMKKTWYLVLPILLFTSVSSSAQDRWENYFQAGMRAFQAGDLPKAELLLKASRLKAELEAEAGNPNALEMRLDSNSAIAAVLRQEGKPAEAEAVLREQLDLLKSSGRGDDDPQTSMALHNLGLVLFDQKKLEEAGKILGRAVELRRKYDPQPQRNLAMSLLSLGGAYFHQGHVREAEDAVLQAREILSKIPAPIRKPEDEASMMRADHNLALIYVEKKNYVEAEVLYKRAITTMEKLYGAMSPGLIPYLNNYAKLLRILKRDPEAKVLEARVETIKKQDK